MAVLPGWAKRKEIRYGTVFPGSNLTNFPLLVSVAVDADVAAELAGGGGIAITGADGTTLCAFGLYPTNNLATGKLLLRFKTDLLTAASTGDVIGYLYYDALQTTVEDKPNTVSDSYLVFMPLGEDPSAASPQILNWVTNTKIGTASAGMTDTDVVPAIVGNGLDFDGDDRVDVAASPIQGAFTMEVWVRTVNSEGSALITSLNGADSGQRFLGFSGGSMVPFGQLVDDSANTVILTAEISAASGVFCHIAWSASPGPSGTASLYFDGVLKDSDPVPSTLNTQADTHYTIADRSDEGSFAFTGTLNEVHISSVVRSAVRIVYGYNNSRDNSDTVTLGPEEILDDTGTGTFLTAQGFGVGTITLGGVGAGYAMRSGSGVCQITLGGSGEGDAPAVAPKQGSGVGVIALGGVGVGYTVRSGYGTCSLTLGGSGVGEGEEVSSPALEVSLNFDTTQTASLNFPTLVASLEAN